MRKKVKVLALAVVFSMVLSCFGVQAFAATANNVEQYDSMLAIGSSISRGCGLGDDYENLESTVALHGIPGSYVTTVADNCGVPQDERVMCTYQGATLSSVLCLLGLEQEENDALLSNDDFTPSFDQMKANFGEGKQYQLAGTDGEFANQDLIVLELGSADLFYRSKIISEFEETLTKMMVKAALTGEYDYDEVYNVIPTLAKEMYNGLEYDMENYTKLLDYIKTYNPDAKVVIVGTYNMFQNMTLSSDSAIPLGNLGNIASNTLNLYLEEIADEYGYEYADVANVSTPASEKCMSAYELAKDFSNWGLNIHPSVDYGLPYMARRVTSVLTDTSSSFNLDIKVDLGYIDVSKVSYVKVNGEEVDFSQSKTNKYELVVSYDWTTIDKYLEAEILQVGIVNEDGTVAVEDYILDVYGNSDNWFDWDYRAYRIYASKDLATSKAIFEQEVAQLQTKIQDILDDPDALISAVWVDGTLITDYTYEDYMFKLSLGDMASKTLTLAVVKDGEIEILSFDLSLENGIVSVDATQLESVANTVFETLMNSLIGDANGNGVLNIVDAQIAYDAANGKYSASELFELIYARANINGDSALDGSDARAIQTVIHNG